MAPRGKNKTAYTASNYPKTAQRGDKTDVSAIQIKILDKRLRRCAEEISALTADVKTVKVIMERWEKRSTIGKVLEEMTNSEHREDSTAFGSANTSEMENRGTLPKTSSEVSFGPPTGDLCPPRKNARFVQTSQATLHSAKDNMLTSTRDSGACLLNKVLSPPLQEHELSHYMACLAAVTDDGWLGTGLLEKLPEEIDVIDVMIDKAGTATRKTNTISTVGRMDTISDRGSENEHTSVTQSQREIAGVNRSGSNNASIRRVWFTPIRQIGAHTFGVDINQRLMEVAIIYLAFEVLVFTPASWCSHVRLASILIMFAIVTMQKIDMHNRSKESMDPGEVGVFIRQEVATLRAWFLGALVSGIGILSMTSGHRSS